MNGYQPIDTIPQNGRLVILYNQDSGARGRAEGPVVGYFVKATGKCISNETNQEVRAIAWAELPIFNGARK